MEQWLEDAKQRIKTLKRCHNLQRIQLELAFETAPRDSRYSNTLVDMMRKEEQIIAKDPNAAVTKSVIQKVDETLRAETRGFFAKAAQRTIKKWNGMKEKFERESQQIASELQEELKSYPLNARNARPTTAGRPATAAVRKDNTPTADELEAEAERLECDYNKNWYKYENFNLQEAFKSQNNRIENDWGTHEKALEDEYQGRREKILGPSAAARTPQSPSQQQGQGQQDPRWQHPEKQKTLIHTAPVLTPTRMQQQQQQQQGVDSPGGWAKGKDNTAINQEV